MACQPEEIIRRLGVNGGVGYAYEYGGGAIDRMTMDERMTLFDAVGNTFAAMPTGGFGLDPRSVEPYAPASQWVIAAFMAISGANFALLYRAFVRRRPLVLARDEEFRLYVGLLAVASAVLALILWDAGISAGEEAVRQGVFQTVSMMTTTGFAGPAASEPSRALA